MVALLLGCAWLLSVRIHPPTSTSDAPAFKVLSYRELSQPCLYERPLPSRSGVGGQLPQILTHEVQPGESLWTIAQQYGVDVATLASINELSNIHHLRVGQKIRVLTVKGTIHRVRPGQALWDIARLYRVSMQDIIQANSLSNPDRLMVGQELVIPGAKVTSYGGARIASAARSADSWPYIWPVRGRITSGFGRRWGRMHEGIDIAASHGHPVVAARAGRVIYAGWRGGYGYTVILDHGSGVTTVYCHLSKIYVSHGQRVAQGARIGAVGSTGYSTGPHLHFEIRINGRAVDPLTKLPR